ncbi:MAG: hypothetical protein DAHOPDDO_03324 [Ignavibacteriaceae bacterium]|jgi:hypothetical protein|nr:hypothetical protein [Ignavibacteriaceae bacterium]MCC7093544.1 T9SS type A sorting domain-containing protein [Ignavibacteriaceae bacterium]NUM62336.1 T9SS type A sorting domain-containing protein [Ignavibacteriaceae bacterium]
MNKLLLTIAILSSIVYGQVTADLTIENQQAVGDTVFYFDIFLTRTGTADVYLGTADFVLTFNSSAFSSPTIVRESSSFWNLTSTSGASVGSAYRLATSPATITGNELIINLNQVNIGATQEEFDETVARINNAQLTHRVGRYRVTNVSDPSAFMNLQWKTTGSGVNTQVFTLAPADSHLSSPVTINAINPPIAPLPVELSSFTAKASNDQVHLRWETKTEVNNFGFEIERASTSPVQEWIKIGFVEGNGNSNSPKEYSFIDKNVLSGNYAYRLKQIDTDGQFKYSPEVNVVVEVPTDYALEQNFPNPFNPSTTIKFSIPEAGMVKLTIFDLLGQEVKILVDEPRQAGSYTELFNASGLNSGVYFYELRVNELILTKKMQLLK